MADPKVKVGLTIDDQLSGGLRKAQDNVASFGKALEGLKGMIEVLGVAELARQLVEFGAKTIEAEADLGKMAQRTGIAVEQLAGFQYAAKLSGVETEGLDVGLKKLNKTISDAAMGNQKAADALKSVGASARDAQGKVANAGDVFLQIADKFSKTKDGADKAALAVQIFGRAGTQLIPMLNQGAQGINDLQKEMNSLGFAIDEDGVQAAEAMEQNLVRLQVAGQGLMMQLLGGLIPALNQSATALLMNAGQFNAVSTAGGIMGEALKVTVKAFEAVAISIDLVIHKFGQLLALDLEVAKMFAGFGDAGALKEKFKDFFSFDPQTKALLDKMAVFFKVIDTPVKPLKVHGSGLEDLQRPDESGNKAAQQKVRNAIEADRLSDELNKKSMENELARLDELKAARLVGEEEYDALRRDDQEMYYRSALSLLDDEIKKAQDLVALGKNGEEKLKAEQEIAKLEARRLETQQKLNALLGVRGGEMDAQIQQARAMALAAKQAGEVELQISAIFDDLKTKEADVHRQIVTHQINELEGEKLMNEARGQAADQLDVLIAKYKELAAASGDPKLISNGKKLGSEADDLRVKYNQLGDDIRAGVTQDFENLFTDLITGSKSAVQAFADFAKAIVNDIAKIIAKMLALYIVKKLLGAFFGDSSGSGDSNGFGDFGDTSVDSPSGFAAGGDFNAGQLMMVGERGPELMVPRSAGTVISNDRMGGLGGVTVNYNIDARGATPGERDRMAQVLRQHTQQAVDMAVAAVAQNSRRRYS